MATKSKQSGNIIGTSQQNNTALLPNNERTKKIVEQERLLEEGRHLTEQGYYDEAIIKYHEAMSPELLLHDYDIESPIFLMSKAQKLQGKYEEALRNINEVLKKHPNVQEGNWHEQQLELEALIKARDTKSNQPIYDYIGYLRGKYKNQLPPKSCRGMCDTIASTIIRLYDHIADFDGGIAFAESFLKFYKKIGPGNPYQPANPYFQIKQAFEQEKKEGFKGCRDARPRQTEGGQAGEPCMGRATKALIKSDYFAW